MSRLLNLVILVLCVCSLLFNGCLSSPSPLRLKKWYNWNTDIEVAKKWYDWQDVPPAIQQKRLDIDHHDLLRF
ncbi:unnamed protein product [Caenorhabditis bovis]|uniref:Uncharacterized protein n=1 Tax=Caenorhabditis bovis TaxID=2654633 RepID=A0A8S1E953_9PELO|nr:unnamed protein product [Caenorhabditis bovis]